MTLLNQIVAIETGAKSTAERDLTNAYHAIQKDALFGGIARTYEPKDDDGEQLPPESTKVQQDVETILGDVARTLTRLFDVTLTKETTNTEARADVAVDGSTLLTDVPVTYLIFLEKKLVDLRTFVSKLPLLDPAEDWSPDGVSGAWASRPVQSTKSKKVLRAMELSPATDKHPAQVQTYQEDVTAGTWTTRKFSGRIPRERQTELLGRIERLTDAVKMAREQANTAEVTDRHAGAVLFGYLFGR